MKRGIVDIVAEYVDSLKARIEELELEVEALTEQLVDVDAILMDEDVESRIPAEALEEIAAE